MLILSYTRRVSRQARLWEKTPYYQEYIEAYTSFRICKDEMAINKADDTVRFAVNA